MNSKRWEETSEERSSMVKGDLRSADAIAMVFRSRRRRQSRLPAVRHAEPRSPLVSQQGRGKFRKVRALTFHQRDVAGNGLVLEPIDHEREAVAR